MSAHGGEDAGRDATAAARAGQRALEVRKDAVTHRAMACRLEYEPRLLMIWLAKAASIRRHRSASLRASKNELAYP
jgi:hypothetical protein